MSIIPILEKIWEKAQESSLDSSLAGGECLHVKGLSGSLKAGLLSLIVENLNLPLLAVFPEREEAESVFEELDQLLGEGAAGFFPGNDSEDSEIALLNPRKSGQQMEVLRGLLQGGLRAVVAYAESVRLKVPDPELLSGHTVTLRPGAETDLYALLETLVSFGYSRESMVEAPGEISLRGGILDLFPYTGESPHRIEFFGNTIESIRAFDAATQLSTGKAGELVLVPALSSERERTASLFQYFPDRRVVFVEDLDRVLADAERDRQRGREGIFDPEALEAFFRQSAALFHHTLSTPPGVLDFGGRMAAKLGLHAAEIRNGLSRLSAEGFQSWIVCEHENQKNRLSDLLRLGEEPLEGVAFGMGPFRRGFSLPDSRFSVYTEADLFGRVFRRKRRERFKEGIPIRELSALSSGDFVVHVDHGIGRYIGLEKISVRGVERECLCLLYQDGDKLYVPVDKMERVQKYRGREGQSPALNKLGGVQWERLKTRTKESVKEVARELIGLYSARQAAEGHAFPEDTTWGRELEASFPFEETPDQARAIEEVRGDMETPRPMDRLVCGDVGFGKTEVAVRAAFKCVSDGRQVAVLVPTTLLAQQHERTFRERLGRFPLVIETLSRFRSPKEQKAVLEKAGQGSVDILIGTHRLLSRDVGFRNLGLLIIDEEQRFGVKHKEKLKAYRKTVDVLTLSATPIPRTLYFSLMGIRDMSLIATPPRDRRPIVTEVLPFSEEVIADAIHHELARDGQVFFVHNRVKSIGAVAALLERLVPGLRVAVAHGQMDEHELEKTMIDFDAGRYGCLVATTIIESGLDLPNVNTLLINRADQMGLAQLYQLRGRVGRSDHQAYAYLFTPPLTLLNEDAIKRLRTIEEFTELGSGFQIAQRDLEIRGAGNLLGVAQSGNMDELGYDLYIKLIEEAVQEIRQDESGEPARRERGVECLVDAGTEAFLPGTYVEDESLRVNLYRRLAEFQDPSDLDAFEKELTDRFGTPPREALNLVNAARLRTMGSRLGMKKILLEGEVMKIFFDESWAGQFATPEQLSEHLRSMLSLSPFPARFLSKNGFGLRVQLARKGDLEDAKKVLQSLG